MIERPDKPSDRESSPRYKRKKIDAREKGFSMKRPSAPKFSGEIDYDAVFDEIERAAPRSAAIVAASYVETGLRFMINTRLVLMTPEQRKDHLYNASGPLNTFNQAIELGYALGLYAEMIHHDLGIIRVVRNEFAHNMRVIDFDTPEIAKTIEKFRFIRTLSIQAYHPSKKAVDEVKSETLGPYLDRGIIWVKNRDRYINSCRFIASALTMVNEVDGQRPKPARLP
jgi:hypothetical protein